MESDVSSGTFFYSRFDSSRKYIYRENTKDKIGNFDYKKLRKMTMELFERYDVKERSG